MKIGAHDISVSGLLTGLYLFSVPVFSYSEEMGLNALPQLIAVLMLALALYQVINKQVFYRNPVIIIYLIYGFWSVIVSFFCEYNVNTAPMFTLLKVGAITVAAGLLIHQSRDFSIAIMFFFLSIFVTVVLNFSDILAMRGLAEAEDEMRLAGTFANANTAALYGLIIIWAGMVQIMEKRKGVFTRFLLVFGIILAGTLVLYSGSRKGLLGFIVIFATFSILAYRLYGQSRGSRFFIVFVMLVGLGIMSYLIATSPFISRVLLIFTGEESSFNTRGYLIQEALRVWNQDPLTFMLGVGPGNFHHYNYLQLYSHSTFTETLVTTGLVGFLIYFAAIGAIFRLYYRLIRQKAGREKIHFQALGVFLILNLLFSAFAVMITDRVSWPIMGMMYTYGMVRKYAEIGRNKLQTSY